MHSSLTSLIIPLESTLVFMLDLLFMICKSPDDHNSAIIKNMVNSHPSNSQITNTTLDQLSIQTTADGSHTFWSATFGEAFHSNFGAKQEAEAKFIAPTHLLQQAEYKKQFHHPVRILDVCYGLGYNSAAAMELCAAVGADLEIIGLEWNPEVPRQVIAQDLHRIWSEPVQNCLTRLAHDQQMEVVINSGMSKNSTQTYTITGKLLIGDARQSIQSIPAGWADAIFLDPFSPPRCPQLWTVEFLTALAVRLAPEGYLATYSCAGAIRGGLQQAGLQIGSVAAVGRKSPSTVAAWQQDSVRYGALPDLSLAEAGLLKTRAGVPYRDLTGEDAASTIIARRQAEQKAVDLPSSSSVRKNLGWNWNQIVHWKGFSEKGFAEILFLPTSRNNLKQT